MERRSGGRIRVGCHTLLRLGVDRHLVGQVGLQLSSALRAEPLDEEVLLMCVAEWHELQPMEILEEGLVQPRGPRGA